jgi:hypothetical protein
VTGRLARRQALRRLAAAAGVPMMAGLAALLPHEAQAHRSHVLLSRLTHNAQTGSWELVHFLHYHDMLELLAVRVAQRRIEPSSVEGRARIALEVEQHVDLLAPDLGVLPLRTVGAEVDGDNLVVYRECAAPRAAGRYGVLSTLLLDLYPDQLHNVSVALHEPPQLLALDAGHQRAAFEWRGLASAPPR